MHKRMVSRHRGGAREAGSDRPGRFALPLLAATVVLLVAASPAGASFHEIKVREVHPGAGDDSYVVLQMFLAGQNEVSGHSMTLYDSSGALTHTSTFSANVANGENQRTLLIGDTAVSPTPDKIDSGLSIPAAGGAACWNVGGFPPVDCVAWGNFSGGAAFESATGTSAGTPVSPGGITVGMAIRRKITPNCATLLEAADDTNVSATDFEEVTPMPRNNASAITETVCAPPSAPDTNITSGPANGLRTNSTEATFTFTASPSAEATFECKLDAEPSFTACTTPKSYPGLVGGVGTPHKFEVRAKHPVNGTDASPAKREWTIDTVAPAASISSHPANPSPGATASFKYSSNESNSTFKCRLSPTEASFTSCPKTGKTYNSLADGEYTFEVLAIDAAGNSQSELEPTTFPWKVSNTVPDTTPPETTIDSKPPDPSDSSAASFTYHSNEPGSTFECKLDEAAFAACPAPGISYSGLANGSHSFQVRAKDPSGNVDPMPAGYTFNVVSSGLEPAPILLAPKPDTRVSAKPPAKTHDRTPTLRFRSTIAPATFECRLDRRPFKPCRSPFTTKPLSFGRHTIKIRAVAGGATDPTPAQASFKVVKG